MTRQDHDRVPRHESFWGDTIQRWRGEGLDGNAGTVLHQLGSDFHGIGNWTNPFPDHKKILSQDEETITYVNGWLETVREWQGRQGTPEHIGWGCTTRDAWENTFKPALENHPHDDVEPERTASGCDKAAKRASGASSARWKASRRCDTCSATSSA